MEQVRFFSVIQELNEDILALTQDHSGVFVLVDTHTQQHCQPLLNLPKAIVISIPAGEESKTLDSCIHIWNELTANNADRKSLLLSLGGGMITDIGSFAATCFKRGIAHINIPTSLLGMVDASIGGKTGIDFRGIKNQIGLFDFECQTLICDVFLKTLPEREFKSGYAEVIKHYLISDESKFNKLCETEFSTHHSMIATIMDAVDIKMNFIIQDPYDNAVRKTLNFGHTVGHAIESVLLETDNPVLHGEAVAIGMIAESYLSFSKGSLPQEGLDKIVHLILNTFQLPGIDLTKADDIIILVNQDKKNYGSIQCVLLDGIGRAKIDQAITNDEVINSLQYYNQVRGEN